jgi:SWI/SNF-related matrix-associated actin-dependent regulator of chromatin subfamily A3
MEGSVEERVLNIQVEKRELVNKAFRERAGNKKAKETRMADVAKLLG